MKRIRIAIQKNGRLSKASQNLLKDCGIQLSSGGTLKSDARNFPLEVLYLRDDDIPRCVSDGVADIGILGQNVVEESTATVNYLRYLDFGTCRLSLAVRREEVYNNLAWFQGKRIATSYPNILRKFLAANTIDAEIEEISGSVEIAPGIGLSDGICDIVSSGSTLLSNGLREVETVCTSQAVLIGRAHADAETKSILERFVFRVDALAAAGRNKYILLNAPDTALNAICELLPGMRSPTIIPLAQPGWSSLQSVVQEDEFWDVIGCLKQVGAQEILVCPIEKMVV